MPVSIEWHGLSCFSIESKTDKNDVTVVTDPYDSSCGLRVPRTLEADILTISKNHPHHNNKEAVKSARQDKKLFLVEGPGEYEVGGAFVYGVASDEKEQNIMYRLEMGGISIVHLGDLRSEPSAKEMEVIGEPDILLVPVGGEGTIDIKKIASVVSSLDPRIVIPMHYKIPNLKADLLPLEKFLKELGVKEVETTKKLKIARKDLAGEEMKVVVVERE